LRDNTLLTNDNKQLRDNVHQLEKEIDSLKAKDIKMMKLLFTLSRKGIAINEMLENEFKSNQNTIHDTINTEKEEEPSSTNDSMYGPIYVEPRIIMNKPQVVPPLNLTNINNSDCNFMSETSKNDIKLTSNLSEQKDESESYKKNENFPLMTNQLNQMETELMKTFKNITKGNERNAISNKSSEINFQDLKSFSKKTQNSLNESIKTTGINEIKDSTNNSEQDIERLSINSNSWNFKNPIAISNLKDKLNNSKKNLNLFN